MPTTETAPASTPAAAPASGEPILAAGLLRRPAYDQAVASARFRRMEAFSAAFLSANRAALARYGRRWVADPLHHVLRQWEYPFVHGQLERARAERGRLDTVLDAGSGATFFPYFIAGGWPGTNVECCDQDELIPQTLGRVVDPAGPRVRARVGDLHALPYPAEHFDAVYCISVLEHTRDYRVILEEFHRVLRPGGRLIVTFDLSVDDRTDITRAGAADLLAALAARFAPIDAPDAGVLAALDEPDVVTTGRLRASHARFMPWKRTWRTFAASLVRGRWPAKQFYDVAVVAGVYGKA